MNYPTCTAYHYGIELGECCRTSQCQVGCLMAKSAAVDRAETSAVPKWCLPGLPATGRDQAPPPSSPLSRPPLPPRGIPLAQALTPFPPIANISRPQPRRRTIVQAATSHKPQHAPRLITSLRNCQSAYTPRHSAASPFAPAHYQDTASLLKLRASFHLWPPTDQPHRRCRTTGTMTFLYVRRLHHKAPAARTALFH